MSKFTAAQSRAELSELANRPAKTPEERFRALEAIDRYVRLTTVRTTDIRRNIVGTCPDMCPEKERYMREWKSMVPPYERDPASNQMDHMKAIKEYSRSSADQELPLPHALRTENALGSTMYFILAHHVDRIDGPMEEQSATNVSDWFHYIWDRTRGIRKDITQQDLCSLTVVELVQQCARFHIHCAARLADEDPSVFDQRINTENLTKCLQTLKYLYADLKLQGVQCPDEREFRAYMMLLYLNEGSFQTELRGLSEEIIHSDEVKFALSVHRALVHRDYVRFFDIVRRASYMNACILLRYFTQIRLTAMNVIRKAYAARSAASFALSFLVRILGFDDAADATGFFQHFGVNVERASGLVTFEAKHAPHSDQPYVANRSLLLVESKRNCSVGEVICGKPLHPWGAQFPPVPCVTSFDEHDYPQHPLLEEMFGRRGRELEQKELIEKMSSQRETDTEVEARARIIDELLLNAVFEDPEIKIEEDGRPMSPLPPDWYELADDLLSSTEASGPLVPEEFKVPATLATSVSVFGTQEPMETDSNEWQASSKPNEPASATVTSGPLVSLSDGVQHDRKPPHSDSTTTMEYVSPPTSTQIAPAGKKRTFFGAVKAPSNSASPMAFGSDPSSASHRHAVIAAPNLPSSISPGSVGNSSSTPLFAFQGASLTNTDEMAPAGNKSTESWAKVPSVMPLGTKPADIPSASPLITPCDSPLGTVKSTPSRSSLSNTVLGSLARPALATSSPTSTVISPAVEASSLNTVSRSSNETTSRGTPFASILCSHPQPAKRSKPLIESTWNSPVGEAVNGMPLPETDPPVPSSSDVPTVPKEEFGGQGRQKEQKLSLLGSPTETTSFVINPSAVPGRGNPYVKSEPIEEQKQIRQPLAQQLQVRQLIKQEQQVEPPLEQQQQIRQPLAQQLQFRQPIKQEQQVEPPLEQQQQIRQPLAQQLHVRQLFKQEQQVEPPLEQQQQVRQPLDRQQLKLIKKFQAKLAVRRLKQCINRWFDYARSMNERRRLAAEIPSIYEMPGMEQMPSVSRIFSTVRNQTRQKQSVNEAVQNVALARHLLPFESFQASELIDPFEILCHTVRMNVVLDVAKLRSVQPLYWKLLLSVPSVLDYQSNSQGFPCFMERWLSECSFARKPTGGVSTNREFFLEGRENAIFGGGYEHPTAICMRLVSGEKPPRDESGGIPSRACERANGMVFFLEESALEEDPRMQTVHKRLEAVLAHCEPNPSAISFLCYAPSRRGTTATDTFAKFERSLEFLSGRNISYTVHAWTEPSKPAALRQSLVFLAKAYCKQMLQISATGKYLEMLTTPEFLNQCAGAELWFRLEQLNHVHRDLKSSLGPLARRLQDGNVVVTLFKHALNRALKLTDKQRLLEHSRLPEDFQSMRNIWRNQLATLRISRPRLPEAYFPPNWKHENNSLLEVMEKLHLHAIPPQLLAAVDRLAESAVKRAPGMETTELTEQLRSYIGKYSQHLDDTQRTQLVSHLRLGIVMQLSGSNKPLMYNLPRLVYPIEKRKVNWIPLLSSISESLMNALLAKGQHPPEVYFVKAEFDKHMTEEWWLKDLYPGVFDM